MGWEVCLPGVELAALASPHDIRGVGDYCGPVKALPERVAHQGAWRHVMATGSGVNVPEQLPTLWNRDATLEDSQGAMFVQLPVDQDKRLGPPGNALRLSMIRG